jgi:hypothetical protein
VRVCSSRISLPCPKQNSFDHITDRTVYNPIAILNVSHQIPPNMASNTSSILLQKPLDGMKCWALGQRERSGQAQKSVHSRPVLFHSSYSYSTPHPSKPQVRRWPPKQKQTVSQWESHTRHARPAVAGGNLAGAWPAVLKNICHMPYILKLIVPAKHTRASSQVLLRRASILLICQSTQHPMHAWMQKAQLLQPDCAETEIREEAMVAPWGLIATRPGVTAMSAGPILSPCIKQAAPVMSIIFTRIFCQKATCLCRQAAVGTLPQMLLFARLAARSLCRTCC